MTAKAPTLVPENVKRPKAPIAPPKPNNLTLEQAFDIMFEKYKDALEELADK